MNAPTVHAIGAIVNAIQMIVFKIPGEAVAGAAAPSAHRHASAEVESA
jgi:hypothetical protein